MFRNKINILVLFIVAGISIVSFQNCAQQGFQSLMDAAQNTDHFDLLQNTQDEDSEKPQVLVFNAVDSSGPWVDIAINPSTGHLAMIDDVASQFCKPDCPSGNLQIGISYIANLLDYPQDRVLKELAALIKGAKAHGFYFLIHTNHEWVITKGANPFGVPTAEWAEYSDWDTPLQKFYVEWGSPIPEIGLKPNFKSAAVRARVSQDIAVIAKFVREQIFTDPELKKLFLGIDSGWETEVTPWLTPDHKTGPLGFGALSLMGYSKDNPPADFQAELGNIVKDFMKFIANRYENEGIPNAKIYSHTLINSNPLRQKANPVDAAKLSKMQLGASIYGAFDPNLIQNNLTNGKWAMIETSIDFAAHYLSQPTNETPPSFINIYNWGNDFHDKPARVEQFAKFFNDPNRQPPVVLKGTVDGLSGTFDLSGWACQVGSKTPVDIQIKAIAPNDSEVLIATVNDSNTAARAPADSVTHQVCGLDTRSNSLANLRFAINIPESVRERHSNSFLNIYALRGGKSVLISQKQFRLPNFDKPADPSLGYTEAVKKAYREILNRVADSAGLAYYVDLMMKGKTESEIRLILQGSVEGKCLGSGGTMSNGACTCAAGSTLTDGVCKVQVAQCERLQSKIAVSAPRVEKLKFAYCLVLKREADAPGLQHHVGTSATIAETIVHFISSPEMNANFYGGQNYTTVSVDVFVESLYKHILNRASDAGKTHWVNEINSGRATREQVIKSFFDSKEIPNRFGDLLGQ